MKPTEGSVAWKRSGDFRGREVVVVVKYVCLVYCLKDFEAIIAIQIMEGVQLIINVPPFVEPSAVSR